MPFKTLSDRLKALLEFAKTTDLQEVLWETGNVKVNFQRQQPAPVIPAEAASSAAQTSVAAPQTAAPLLIKSTMVGTFYRSDTPDRPPFVVEGTVVTAGQAVGAIEAMKIMKDVVAPMPCRIVKALAGNGQPVEYGQPLFEVEIEEDETNV